MHHNAIGNPQGRVFISGEAPNPLIKHLRIVSIIVAHVLKLIFFLCAHTHNTHTHARTHLHTDTGNGRLKKTVAGNNVRRLLLIIDFTE